MKYSVSCYLSRLARMRLFEGLTQDEIRVPTCLLGGDILSRRSVRGCILTWLSYESQRHGSSSFHIHMDRKAMANYLCVEQTALSATLFSLQKEGLIQIHGSRFTLYPEARQTQSAI